MTRRSCGKFLDQGWIVVAVPVFICAALCGGDGWEFVVTPLLILAVSIMDSIESMQQLGLRTFRCHLTPLRPVSMRVETSADRLYDLILKGTRTGAIPVESLNRSDTGSIVLISGFSCAEFVRKKVSVE